MAVTAQWLFYNYTMIENYTFLRNESQSLKFLDFRRNVFSAKSPLVILSVRQNVRSTKCPSAKCPFGKMSFGKVSFGKVSFGKMSGHRYQNNYSTKALFNLKTRRCIRKKDKKQTLTGLYIQGPIFRLP